MGWFREPEQQGQIEQERSRARAPQVATLDLRKNAGKSGATHTEPRWRGMSRTVTGVTGFLTGVPASPITSHDHWTNATEHPDMLVGMRSSNAPRSRYVVAELVNERTGEVTGVEPVGDDLEVAKAIAKKRAETTGRNVILVDSGCDRRVATFRPPPS
jgi:hypothetical protein